MDSAREERERSLHSHDVELVLLLRGGGPQDGDIANVLLPIENFIDSYLRERNLSETLTIDSTPANLLVYLFPRFRSAAFVDLVQMMLTVDDTDTISYIGPS